MNVSERERRIITILTVFTIVFTFFGASLAYWSWESNESQKTAVGFTVTQDFSCSVDGGGDITQTDAFIAPTTCTNSTHAIKRTITVSPEVLKDNINVNMDLWIEVKYLQDGLKNSDNFKYALTTDSSSCESGVVSSGNLKNLTTGDTKTILKKNYGTTTTDTYYLWIWLDAAETSTSTMDQSFSLTLGGECTNTPSANHPELDDGMIPVTIADNGAVTTVSSMDDDWYDYENKEWANVVLLKEEGTKTRSYYKNNPGETVDQDDILAYYVWIPRYSYRIPSYYCSDIENVNETDYPDCYDLPYTMTDDDKDLFIPWVQQMVISNFGVSDYTIDEATLLVKQSLQTGIFEMSGVSMNFSQVVNMYNNASDPDISYSFTFVETNISTVNNPREIGIQFEASNAIVLSGDAVNTYYTHPAFIWDGEPISGIWVGKFETSHTSLVSSTTANNLGCTDENCATADGLLIKPNVVSLSWNSVSNQFFASRSMTRNSNPFGLSLSQTDSHMMKNSEWGAVAYLSHSQYGINQEIYTNNSSGHYTGRSGGNVGGSVNSLATQFSDDTLSTLQYNSSGYYTWTGQIIDSSGTIGEYASDRTLGTNASTTGNVTGVYDMSGGAHEHVMGNYASTISESGFTAMPDSKYYDLYSSTQFTGTNSTNVTLCTLETCGGHALYETVGWYSADKSFVNAVGPWFSRGSVYSGGSVWSFGNGDGVTHYNASFRSTLINIG